MTFAISNGPMLFAVILLRNSLVPHSMDMMTSNHIHIAPALAFWSVSTAECSDYPVH